MALQYVEAQRQARPDLAEWYASLADLYQRRLWHQLTLKLDQFLQLQAAQVRFLICSPPRVREGFADGFQMC
jgi:hypothetical protein